MRAVTIGVCGVMIPLAVLGARLGRVEPSARVSAPAAPAAWGLPHLPIGAGFAPDTTPEQMADAYRALLDRMGGLEANTTSRWPGTVGTPVTLTYSFCPDGTSTPDGPSQLFSAFAAGDFGGDTSPPNGRPDWQDLFRQMFDRWTEITGNSYIETTDDGAPWPNSEGAPGVRGDLRIVCAPIDGGGNIWAFNFFPGQLQAGDMQFDVADVLAYDLPTNNFRRFRNLAGHEHGHGQGLRHVCPAAGQIGGRTKLMEPFIVDDFDGPQIDDVIGSQTLYGDPFEPNNSLAQATPFSAPDGALTTILDLSIHGVSDFDYFELDFPNGGVVNLAVVAPAGGSYLEGNQNGDGSCQAGVTFEAVSQANLAIAVLSASGTVISEADANGVGQSEQLAGVVVPSGGGLIRIRQTGGFVGTQVYGLAFNIEENTTLGDLSGDGRINGLDVSLLLNVFGSSNQTFDLNNDGVVNGGDVAVLLNNWTG